MNVTVNDVTHYLDVIETTMNHTLNFDNDQLYEYFQKCEYEYIINSQENFAKIVHLLCPRKYLADMSNEILVNPNRYATNSLFICCDCKSQLTIKRQQLLHKTKVKQVCQICSRVILFNDIVLRALIKRNLMMKTTILCVDSTKFINCNCVEDFHSILSNELGVKIGTQNYYNMVSRANSLISYYAKCITCTSFDLIEGMYRQYKFISKVVSNIDYYRDKNVIEESINRYTKFMTLIAENKNVSFVPTTDIDIVWHSHQLDSEKYKKFCININGFLINHDDTIDSNSLDESYRVTYDMWKLKYGEKYSTKKPTRTPQQKVYNYWFQYLKEDPNKKIVEYDCGIQCTQFTDYLTYISQHSDTNDHHSNNDNHNHDDSSNHHDSGDHDNCNSHNCGGGSCGGD